MRTLLFFSLLFCFLMSDGQTVIKDEHFDNYINPTTNDFTNNFSGNSDLTQIPNSGITGGCLATPDSNLWGNDNAVYCATYKGTAAGTVYRTSICFKYNSSIANPNGYDRTCSIWLIPQSDFNHYLITSVTHDLRIQTISYSWVNPTSPVMSLQNNHWYKLVAEYTFLTQPPSSTIDVNSKVFDLGTTGLSTPSLISSITGTFNDSTLVTDTTIYIGLTGARFGGASHLDDFHFEGKIGQDVCVPTSINDIYNDNNIFAYSSNDYIQISNTSGYSFLYKLRNISGQMLYNVTSAESTLQISTNDLPHGIYFLEAVSPTITFTKKLLIRK